MNEKKILIQIDKNNEKLKLIKIRKIVKNYLFKKFEKLKIKQIELGIYFVTDKKIMLLNKKYRCINKPTDVLSFPIYENIFNENLFDNEKINLGDIFISYKIAKKQAKEMKISFEKEITKLILHGVKHLIGIHHK